MPRIITQDSIYRDDDYIESANHRNSRYDSLTKYTNTIKSKVFDALYADNNYKDIAIDNKWTDEELAADTSRTAIDIMTPSQAFSSVTREADYTEFFNLLNGVQSIVSKGDTNTLGVAANSIAVQSPTSQAMLTDEENSYLEKASKSAALELIEIFYQAYMSPLGTNDITYRLGGVTGIVVDPKTIANIPGYTTSAGEIYTPSNLQFSFTRKEYSNDDIKRLVDPTTDYSTISNILENKQTTNRKESYANLLFPPYAPIDDIIEDSSALVGEDSYDTADFGEKTKVSAKGYYGKEIKYDKANSILNKSYTSTVETSALRSKLDSFNTKYMLSGRSGATYRAPGFRAVNDNINFLQTLLEKTTGIVSTYMTEWDLSLYMQEGLVSVNDDSEIEFVTKLNYRLIDDAPQISDDDIDKSGSAIASTNSVSEKNYLKAVCFGTINSAVSSLRAGSYGPWNDLEYYPQLSPYSPWWVAPTGDAQTQVWEATGAESTYENSSGDETSSSQANTVMEAVDLTSGDVSASAASYEGEWTNGMPVFWATSGFFNYNNAYYNSQVRNLGLATSPDESKLSDIVEPANRTSDLKQVYDYANGGFLKAPADLSAPSIWLGLKPSTDSGSNILSRSTNELLARLDQQHAVLSGWLDYDLPMWKQLYTDDTDGLSDIDQAIQEIATEQPYSIYDVAQTVYNEANDDSNGLDNTKNAAKVESGLNAASGSGTATPPSTPSGGSYSSSNESDYKFKLLKCSLTIPGSSLLKMFLKRSSKTSQAMNAGNSSSSSSNGNVMSDPVGAVHAFQPTGGLEKNEIKTPRYDENGNPVIAVTTYTDPATGETSLKEEQVYDTVVVPSQEGVGKQYSQGNGIASWSPFLYGGPHGRYRSPATVQGYFEPDNIFLRSCFRFPLKEDMLPHNGSYIRPFEMHQKYLIMDPNLNDGVAKQLELVGTGHSDNDTINYAGLFYMAMRQTTGELALLTKGFRYFPSSAATNPNDAVLRYNIDLHQLIDKRYNVSYDGNYNISKSGGVKSLEDEDAAYRSRLTFTDVLNLRYNSTTISYRRKQKEFVLATDYDSKYGFCVPLSSKSRAINKPYDADAVYIYRPNYIKVNGSKYVIPCDMCLYMYLQSRPATQYVSGSTLLIASDLSNLKTNGRVFKMVGWDKQASGEFTNTMIFGDKGDVHSPTVSVRADLSNGNYYKSNWYVPMMYMDIVNALWTMRFTDGSQSDLRWYIARYKRRSHHKTRYRYYTIYYTVNESWRSQMFTSWRGHWSTTWNCMTLANAIEQFYPGYRGKLESRGMWRQALPTFKGFSNPMQWQYLSGGDNWTIQVGTKQVRDWPRWWNLKDVPVYGPSTSAKIRAVYKGISSYINTMLTADEAGNYFWYKRGCHTYRGYTYPSVRFWDDKVANKIFSSNTGAYVSYSGNLSRISSAFNDAITRGRVYNDWSWWDSQTEGNRDMSNIIHHGSGWHANYHAVKGIANTINGSSASAYAYGGIEYQVAEEHTALSEAILKMISKATYRHGTNSFYGLFYQENGQPNYEALKITYAPSRNSEDDAIKSDISARVDSLQRNFIAPYNPTYNGQAHVTIPFGITGVERPVKTYVSDVMSAIKNDKLFVFKPDETAFTRANSLNYTVHPVALPDIIDPYDNKLVGAGDVNWAIVLAPNGWKEANGKLAGELYNELYDKTYSSLANLDFTDNGSVDALNEAFSNLREANNGNDTASDGALIFRLLINPKPTAEGGSCYNQWLGRYVQRYKFANNSALTEDSALATSHNFKMQVSSWNFNGRRWASRSASFIKVWCDGSLVAHRICAGRGTTLWRIDPTTGSVSQVAYQDTYDAGNSMTISNWLANNGHNTDYLYAISIWDAATLGDHLVNELHNFNVWTSSYDSDRQSYAAILSYQNTTNKDGRYNNFAGSIQARNGSWRYSTVSTVTRTWTYEIDPWTSGAKIEHLFMNNRDEVFWDVVDQQSYPIWGTRMQQYFHCWWWRGCHWRHRTYQTPHYKYGHYRYIAYWNTVDILKPKYVNYTQSIEELKLYNMIQKCCNKSANIYAPWTLGSTPMLYVDFEDNAGHLFSMGMRAIAPERYRVRKIHWVRHVRYEHAHYRRSYWSFDWHACAGWWWEKHWVSWCGYDYPVYYYTFYYTYNTDYFRQIAVYPTTMRYCLTKVDQDHIFKYRTERQTIESAQITIEAQGNQHNNQTYPSSTEAYVRVLKNGTEVSRKYNSGRGFTLFSIDPKTCSIENIGYSDTWSADTSCTDIYNMILDKCQSSDKVYALVSFDAISMSSSLISLLSNTYSLHNLPSAFTSLRQTYVALFATNDSEWFNQCANVDAFLKKNETSPTLNNTAKVKMILTTSTGASTSDIVGTSASDANIEPFRRFMVDWTKTGSTNGQGAPYRAREMSKMINPWSKTNPSIIDATEIYNAGRVIMYNTTVNGCTIQKGYPDESNRAFVGQYALTGQHLFFNELFTEANGKIALDEWKVNKASNNAPARLSTTCIYRDYNDQMKLEDYTATLDDSFAKNFGELTNWSEVADLPDSTKEIIKSNIMYGNILIQPPTSTTGTSAKNPYMMNSSYSAPLVSLLMTMQTQKAWVDKTAEIIKSAVTDSLINGTLDADVDPMIIKAIDNFENKKVEDRTSGPFYSSNGTWDEDAHFDILLDLARKNFANNSQRVGYVESKKDSYSSTNSLYTSLMAMSAKFDAYIPKLKERIKMHASADKMSAANAFAEMMKTSEVLDMIRKDKDIFGQAYNGDTLIGAYTDSFEMKMLSYLQVLYQYRKYFVNKRFNKQDGSYWAMRALERVLPSTSQILSTSTLKPVSTSSSSAGTSSYPVVLMDISNSYIDKGNALIAANSDSESTTVLSQDCIDAVYVKVQYVTVPEGYSKLEDSPDFRTITEDDAKDTEQTKETTVIVDGVPQKQTVQKWTESDVGKTFYKDKEVVYIDAHGVAKKPRWAYKPENGVYMLYSDEVKKALQTYENTDFATAFSNTSTEATRNKATAIKDAALRVSGYTWNIDWDKLAVKSDNVAYPVYNDYTKVGRHKYGVPKLAYPKECGIVFDLTLSVDIDKIQALGGKLLDADAMAALCAVKETVDCWWIKVPPTLRILSTDESKSVMLTKVKTIDDISLATQATTVAGVFSNIVYPIQETSEALMTNIKTYCNSYFS